MSDNNEKLTDDKPQNHPQIKLTGRMLNFTRLQLQGDDKTALFSKIEEKLSKQQNSKLPVIVSYTGSVTLAELWEKLWELGLQPIGIIPSSDEQTEQATEQKIAIFPADGQRIDGKNAKSKIAQSNENKNTQNLETTEESPDKPTEPNSSIPATTMETAIHTEKTAIEPNNMVTVPQNIAYENSNDDNKLHVSQNEHSQNVEGDLVHHQMLRSGQSINHVGGDVILTKGINAGAEAITDYSLHIYGKAEGRLVAGATGDKNARIFCMKFNPSLVSVAGTYCLKENIPAEFLNKAVEVSFDDEKGLVFSLIE